ncbi:MAG TPA: hypothetical protein VGO16_15275 [Pseudonocardiaceae bacterium]|nr:hypothetical protein [Pseudonocardiaceae bacterium]
MVSSCRRSGVVILALGLALAGCGSGAAKGSGDAKSPAPKGADPVAWVGAFCGGLGEVIAGAAALGKVQATPQGQKDGLLAFADSTRQAFTNTAHKLEQVGPPAITDGQRVQDTVVGFFTTSAGTVAGQREKIAALPANEDFDKKARELPGPDIGETTAQMQGLASDPQLAPAFGAAPECQRLSAAPGPR